ncbi:SigE family RNA polymerase sigma factor [Jatrophihabitans sp. DSM 45814]
MEVTAGSGVDFDTLYATQWHKMMRLAILLVDDRASAEDVVQDAFVAMYRKPLRNPDAAVGYLRTSVVNGARSALRKRMTTRKHALREALLEADGIDDSLAAAENADVITGLQGLPRRQREVLVLRYWLRLSEAEIAQTLGVSTGTVKSTASRGLDALESLLGGVR